MLMFWAILLVSLICVNGSTKKQTSRNLGNNAGGSWRDSRDMRVWEIIGELNPHYQEFIMTLPTDFQNTFVNPDRQISIIIPAGKIFTGPGTSIDKQTVRYNMLTERMFSGQEGTKKYRTYFMNHNVMCYRNGEHLYMNDMMVKAAYQGSNGMVIVLDYLLPKPPHTKGVLDEKTPFSQILLAIQRRHSNLDVNTIGSYFTVFAPILGMDWDSFQKKYNLTTLEKQDSFLLAHIVPNDVMVRVDMTAPRIIKSFFQGFTYSLVPGKPERVNGRKILEYDHFVSIGVVHVIEKPIATPEEILARIDSVPANTNNKQTGSQFNLSEGGQTQSFLDPTSSIKKGILKIKDRNQQGQQPKNAPMDPDSFSEYENSNPQAADKFPEAIYQNDAAEDGLVNEQGQSKNTLEGEQSIGNSLKVPTLKQSSQTQSKSPVENGDAEKTSDLTSKAQKQQSAPPEQSDPPATEIKELGDELKTRGLIYAAISLFILAGAMGSCVFIYHKNGKSKSPTQ